MRDRGIARKLWIGALGIALLLALEVPALGAEPRGPRVVSALGSAQVDDQQALVDVLVVVPRGESVSAAKREALAKQGARPVGSAGLGSTGFQVTGLVWDVLPVVQNYNPANEQIGTGQQALTNTHATWDGVATSFFDIDFGGLTTRCPSLVQQCAGPQTFDGFNDVGWQGLDRKTLAVTWYGTSTDEADMAANTRFRWHDTCTDVKNSYDFETVAGHENGHVVGLDHSNDKSALMYPSYQGTQCSLAQDDVEGATYLYPTQTATVSGVVTDTSANPIAGATVALAGTPFSAATQADGSYSVSGVPYTVTYDVTASSGSAKSTQREQINTAAYTVDFVLDTGGGGGGGEQCKPAWHPKCQ